MLRRLAKLWIGGLAALALIAVFIIPYRQRVRVPVLGTNDLSGTAGTGGFASVFAEWAIPVLVGLLILFSIAIVLFSRRAAAAVHSGPAVTGTPDTGGNDETIAALVIAARH